MGPSRSTIRVDLSRTMKSNAVWGMQFIWPFKAEYRIIFLSEDYSRTVIGRSKRDYVWIMAQQSLQFPMKTMTAICGFFCSEQGYDTKQVAKSTAEGIVQISLIG
jgi:apolipoprotein D and lipocalin family protein